MGVRMSCVGRLLCSAILLIAFATLPAGPAAAAPVSMTPVPGWAGLDRVQRIVYTTPGADGAPTTASALVRVPLGEPPVGGWRIVAWDHGTSGLARQCGLTGSEQLQAGTGPTVARLNEAGYAVVAPDYLGLSPESTGTHPYLNTRTEATATIDAVRAANAAVDGLSSTWAVAGSSQGGHAALATGHLAPTYAPGLDFRGTAALAPASNIENIFTLAFPALPRIPLFPVANFAAVLTGMDAAGVEVRPYLSGAGRAAIDGMATTCAPDWPSVIGGTSPGALLAKPLVGSALSAEMRSYMAVPSTGYRDPILIVHGVRDTTVPIPLTVALLGQLAAGGNPAQFQAVNSGHEDVREKGGLDRTITFLDGVMPSR